VKNTDKMSADDIRGFVRMQFKAILELPEAEGREQLAIGLVKGGMGLDEAKQTLQSLPAAVSVSDTRLQDFVEQKRSESSE